MNKTAMPIKAAKIIFFDVDGVLNTYRTQDEEKANGMGQLLSYPHVMRLQGLRAATGARLVCVSSWRKYEENIAALKEANLWEGLFTEYDNEALPTRADEVQDWLDWVEHKPSRLVILDDKPEKYFTNPLLYNIALAPGIVPELGLNGEQVLWAERYLNAVADEPVIDDVSMAATTLTA